VAGAAAAEAPVPPKRKAAATVDVAAQRKLIAERLPRVEYLGGPFIRRPRVVTITFAGDSAGLVARLERFGEALTRTNWWRTVSEEYCAKAGDCIGEGQPGLAVRLEETLPADVHADELGERLAGHAKAGRFGTIDPDTVLLVYLPKGVTLRDATVPRYCEGGPRAVHRALRVEKHAVGLAIVPRCGDEATLTGTASHELLEATTNPDAARRGFAFKPQPATEGFLSGGVEPVDPCVLLLRGRNRATEHGRTMQRAWSNRAAAEGTDPCVPHVGSAPFVALVPEQPSVHLKIPGEHVKATFEAAASGEVRGWKVSVLDLTGVQDAEHYVDVALDRAYVMAGQRVTLTIVLRKRPPQGRSIVGLVSAAGQSEYLWPLVVTYGGN
jgi:hypothetical protein